MDNKQRKSLRAVKGLREDVWEAASLCRPTIQDLSDRMDAGQYPQREDALTVKFLSQLVLGELAFREGKEVSLLLGVK